MDLKPKNTLRWVHGCFSIKAAHNFSKCKRILTKELKLSIYNTEVRFPNRNMKINIRVTLFFSASHSVTASSLWVSDSLTNKSLEILLYASYILDPYLPYIEKTILTFIEINK